MAEPIRTYFAKLEFDLDTSFQKKQTDLFNKQLIREEKTRLKRLPAETLNAEKIKNEIAKKERRKLNRQLQRDKKKQEDADLKKQANDEQKFATPITAFMKKTGIALASAFALKNFTGGVLLDRVFGSANSGIATFKGDVSTELGQRILGRITNSNPENVEKIINSFEAVGLNKNQAVQTILGMFQTRRNADIETLKMAITEGGKQNTAEGLTAIAGAYGLSPEILAGLVEQQKIGANFGKNVPIATKKTMETLAKTGLESSQNVLIQRVQGLEARIKFAEESAKASVLQENTEMIREQIEALRTLTKATKDNTLAKSNLATEKFYNPANFNGKNTKKNLNTLPIGEMLLHPYDTTTNRRNAGGSEAERKIKKSNSNRD